jgi:hypothetical protein
MFVANADYMLSWLDNKINADIGTSFYNNPYDYRDPTTGAMLNALTHSFSGFTKIGLYDRVAILAETDFRENSISENMTRAMYGFGELSIKIIKGLELRSQYEFRNANRDIDNQKTRRYSIGGAIFPIIGVEFEAMFRFVDDDISASHYNEYQGMLHFYF